MSCSAQSSPVRIGSVSKSANVLTQAKTTLSEQHNRLSNKHNIDLDLIDDLRAFIKTKCNIEKDYSQSLIKLANSQSKKYPTFVTENDSEIKTLYSSWKTYLEEMEKFSKNRLSQFEQLSVICDTLKHMRTHKLQVSKKSIDQHLKKMQEEVLTSISDIDKTRKLYFDEEHLAKQARDKEEKIKKRKTGLFSSFTNLQSKKEKTSAHREASDIQSTQARNDYIMALAAGNAHLEHYYSLDLPILMRTIDDDVLDKCRGFILSLLESEMYASSMSSESIDTAIRLVESTSADFTNSTFLTEPQSACLRDQLVYEFDPCDNDTIDVISLEHNADIALRNEVTKWYTWFQKECRNLNRLSQQLIKCQSLLAEGQKTVEVSGSGPVDLEVRIDDIKQQIRKCEISKLKAKARLQVIKDSGFEMEDFDSFEAQITTEIKQTSLDVDINIGMPLSRTPSLRSTNISDGGRISSISDGGRISSLDGNRSDDQQTDTDNYQTPEPDMTSARSLRPESSSSEQPESPEREPQYQKQYQSFEANANWGEYDPTQVWEDEPTPVVDSTVDSYGSLDNGYDNNYESVEETNIENYAVPVDGTTLVGKMCLTLYPYESQSQDELSFLENESFTIIEASDKDWVKAQNDRYMIGFVPAAYLQVIGDAPQQDIPSIPELANTEESSTNENQINNKISNESEKYVRAVYDYTATSDEEISFNEGEIFKLLSKSEDGWWTAEKDGLIGHFPSMLVLELGGDTDSAAFAESISGEESEESIESPATPLAPPPSFAPPKPAYLTPHQVVIIQPTPEIESKPSLGEEDNNEIETNETIIKENDSQEDNDPNAYVINPEFTLEKPTPKANEESSDAENVENVENVENAVNVVDVDENGFNYRKTVITVSVEQIEITAEEISEAITHEAICDAAKESHSHDNCPHIDCQNDSINNNYNNNNNEEDFRNEDSDYEDIK